MPEPRYLWTRNQTIVALNLYCKIPFAKVTSNQPDIIKLAKLIGRSPNSVKMKIGNFGAFDPELRKQGIVGLGNTSKLDKEIWDEFSKDWENLAYQSETLIAQFSNQNLEELPQFNPERLPAGLERETVVKRRVNQAFFRTAVLTSYNNRCCITGLSQVPLLEACHIVSWSENPANRLNPSNGLSLNVLFHKAYDNHYLSVSPDYKIHVAKDKFRAEDSFESDNLKRLFFGFADRPILLPEKFFPNKDFLAQRHESFLKMLG